MRPSNLSCFHHSNAQLEPYCAGYPPPWSLQMPYSVRFTPYMLEAQPIANVHPINFELSRSYRHLNARALSCLAPRPDLYMSLAGGRSSSRGVLPRVREWDCGGSVRSTLVAHPEPTHHGSSSLLSSSNWPCDRATSRVFTTLMHGRSHIVRDEHHHDRCRCRIACIAHHICSMHNP